MNNFYSPTPNNNNKDVQSYKNNKALRTIPLYANTDSDIKTKNIISVNNKMIMPKQEYYLVLRSVDAINYGTSNSEPTFCIFNVQLPKFTSTQCKIHVRSIVFGDLGGKSLTAPIAAGLHIKEFLMNNSYSSATGGPDDQLCQIQSYGAVNALPDTNGKIIDCSFLSNNRLTVYFTNIANDVSPSELNGNSATFNVPTGTVEWSLDLCIQEI